jgi:hypothetical protein
MLAAWQIKNDLTMNERRSHAVAVVSVGLRRAAS